ncbi:MAG: response regulator, partial [Altererythrobacter sp.]|nr:response regulator [Altererythrobacter sp.]
MASLEDLSPEEQARILKLRLERAERAQLDAEVALEGRMRELDRANTELSQRESELAKKLDVESRKLLAAQSTAQMATIYGEKGKPFTASEGAGVLLGLPDHEEGTLEKLIAAIHPLDKDRILRVGVEFFTTLKSGIDHEFEHRIIRLDDGSTRWLRWVIRRETGVDDRPSAVFGTVRDITRSRANERAVRALQLRAERRVAELNKLSQQLAEEQAKTAEALTARTQFLSEMAHAIRTPLNSLTGGLELVADELAGKSQDFEVVRDAADQLAEIASKLIEQADTGEFQAIDVQLDPVSERSNEIGHPPPAPKVLLAEDTESNRYVIERLLNSIGCEATTVTNGVEAVEAARAGSFDVILMDVMMPI